MIPVDIDNFIVYEIFDYIRKGSIYIKNTNVIPRDNRIVLL